MKRELKREPRERNQSPAPCVAVGPCRSSSTIGAIFLATVCTVAQAAAFRAEVQDAVDVYFGCGCFWHVQHEFVEAERKILNRKETEYTAFVGYAGGLDGSVDGRVCYHNGENMAEYSSLGHAEVVRLQIPASKFGSFAEAYVKLFDNNGYRPDQVGDRGPEYRNLVGLPDGVESELFKKLKDAASGSKLTFQKGNGSDADLPAIVHVMDIKRFPFFLGEPYHQFHDGFAPGEDYPDSYASMREWYLAQGRIQDTGCPRP